MDGVDLSNLACSIHVAEDAPQKLIYEDSILMGLVSIKKTSKDVGGQYGQFS